MKPDLTTLNISINGTQLNRIGNDRNEKSSKFHGIYIDERLTWKHHINHMFRKTVSYALFSLRQVKRALPSDCLQTLYYVL